MTFMKARKKDERKTVRKSVVQWLRPCLQMVNLSRKSSSIRDFPKRKCLNCANLVWNRQQSNFEPP